MSKRNRPSLSTTVGKATFNTIQLKAIELDTTASNALDLIVREWLENTKTQPLYKGKNQADLSQLQQTLIAIEEMLDIVADCLTKTTS